MLAAGAVLVLLALHGALRQWRRSDETRTLARYGAGHPSHEHGESDGPHGRSWALLLAPVACLALLAPQALGSYSAGRAVSAAPVRPVQPGQADAGQVDVSQLDAGQQSWSGWAPLPAGDIVPLSLGEFITRAQWDESRSLTGRTVRLTGFVLRRGAMSP